MGNQKQKIQLRKSYRNIAIHIAIFLFYVLYFRWIINSGLSADDMWNSNIQAAPDLNGPSPWEVMRDQFFVWLKLGRVFPFSNYAALLFSLLPSVPAYKAWLVGMTYLDNLICSFCVKRITGSETISFLSMLMIPVLMQLTPEFDSGLYCYHGLIQMVVLDCFLSLWFLLLYLDKRKTGYVFGSAFCFFLALGTYEAAFPFIFVLLWTAWRETGGFKAAMKACIPNLFVFLAMGLANVCARLFLQDNQYQGITVNLSPGAVLLTFFKQCATCIPLGRYLCSGLKYCDPYSDVYPYGLNDLRISIRPLDIAVICLFLAICIRIYFIQATPGKIIDETEKTKMETEQAEGLAEAASALEDNTEVKKRLFTLMGIGLFVFLLPGVLIAISEKYQQTLGWCGGHLPAYMQSIGFGLLITGFLVWLLKKVTGRKSGRTLLFLFLGGIATIMLLNQISGRAAVEYMNGFRKYPQENLARAADAGFFEGIADEEKKIVVGTTSYIYDNYNSSEFYSKFTASHIEAVSRKELLKRCVQTFGISSSYDISLLGEEEYWGLFNQSKKKEGSMILGRCSRVDVNAAGTDLSHVWIENPQIFLRGEEMYDIPDDWILIKSGEDYQIYEAAGMYDIMQEQDYYQSEAETGVLYR